MNVFNLLNKTMNTTEKIEKLNKECKKSLSICHYTRWEVHSYQNNSLLCMEKHYPFFEADTLKETIDMAYKFVFKNEQ